MHVVAHGGCIGCSPITRRVAASSPTRRKSCRLHYRSATIHTTALSMQAGVFAANPNPNPSQAGVFGGVLCGVFLNRILPELVIVIVLAIVLGVILQP